MQNILQFILGNKTKITLESLKKWNLILVALYVIQGGAILLLSISHFFQISVLYVTKDTLQSQLTGQTVIAPATHQLFIINLVGPVAAFLFIAAILHFLSATIWRNQYENWIKKNINPLRWLEYGLNGGIILIVIGLLAGIYDIASLLMLFAFAIMAALMGLFIEANTKSLQVKQLPKWLDKCVVYIAFLIPWIIIGFYLKAADFYGSGTQVMLYVIYLLTLILFIAIFVNVYLMKAKKYNWKDYLYTERWHFVLSFVAQSLLAWLVYIDIFHS
jgi:hypothetical protein